MGSGWDFHRPFSRTDWMAGIYDKGRKSVRRSCIHWSSQAEKGWEESAVRRSISGLIPSHYRRIYIERKIGRILPRINTDKRGSGGKAILAVNEREECE